MSQLALRSLGNSSNMMTQAMERLSTGKRVNSASDDAAGLGIATKLRAQVNSLNAATRNAPTGFKKPRKFFQYDDTSYGETLNR